MSERCVTRAVRAALVCLAGVGAAGCGDTAGPAPDATVALDITIENLAPLNATTEGRYHAWVIDAERTPHSAGAFTVSGPGAQTISLTSPIGAPAEIMITIEPPNDTDAKPGLRLIGGRVSAGAAELETNRFLTPGVPLEPNPGQHYLFTPSDNFELGYPSYEDAGIWVMNFFEKEEDGTFFVTFTPLTPGWTYEGWVVRDWGTPGEIWVSYGKFNPDNRRKANSRDNTGLGPYSGQLQYASAMQNEVYFPGDDWLANPHGFPIPGNLELPFDLNGDRARGIPSRWTHVITIEPASDMNEAAWLARPFFLRPYRNAIGEGAADEGRDILFFPEALPSGSARLRS